MLRPPQPGRGVDNDEETTPATSVVDGGGARALEPRAACDLLLSLLRESGDAWPPTGGAGVQPTEDAEVPVPAESPFTEFTELQRRRAVDNDARVRPPLPTRVDARFYAGHPRLCSVLSRGLKVRVPAAVPRVWAVTPRSALMTAAVRDFLAAGILRPGQPQRCFRLVPIPKTDSTARLIYDLSAMTPFMHRRPCRLPSVERAMELAAEGYVYAVKIDLRDGYYHIPLAASQAHFGVCYEGRTYVFSRLPMGWSHSAAEMQHFACATVKLVEERFPGVKGIAYLDDFLFMARNGSDLAGIDDFFASVGINVNFEKSVLSPVSHVIYLGVELDLVQAAANVKPEVLGAVREAMLQCGPDWSILSRQRLAGYVNFLRPCLKLPLEVVRAILDGDLETCRSVVPFLAGDVKWTFCDMHAWNALHERHVFVDATPKRIGIVRPGSEPVSVHLPLELPIYVAEYVAALTAVLSVDVEDVTIFSDNMGVYFNLHRGRCPRPFVALLCHIFRDRRFSVGFIASAMNPADAPSRAPAQ